MTSPAVRFVDALRGASRAAEGIDEALALIEGRLAALHAAASRAWHPVSLDAGQFAQHLGACVASDPRPLDPLEALDALHTGDLYLACAAGQGAPGAVELFVNRFVVPAARLVPEADGALWSRDDVAQALQQHLLWASDGPPRVLAYEGRAPLAAWLGVAARRLMWGAARAEAARRRLRARIAEEPAQGPTDPELGYLKARYGRTFEEAVGSAVEALSPRSRAVLRLHTMGELPLARIGALYGVDESTASRWLKKARAEVLEGTRRALSQRLRASTDEVDSLVRLLDSQIDISLARLLASGVRER